MPNLSEMRKECQYWDEEMGCLDDYPDECPLHEACKNEAEGSGEEEKVPA